MKLLVSTGNPHKLVEIRAILTWPGIDLISLADFPDLPEVEEDRDTFEGNALKKAETNARATGLWAIADDSGLEVDALGGEPGVYSARYAGEPPDYDANNRKLLSELDGIVDRSARFRCVMALCSPDGMTSTVDGRCEGTIASSCRGANGFGYDPLFVPSGYEETFAELDAATKNRISHRAHALQHAGDEWAQYVER